MTILKEESMILLMFAAALPLNLKSTCDVFKSFDLTNVIMNVKDAKLHLLWYVLTNNKCNMKKPLNILLMFLRYPNVEMCPCMQNTSIKPQQKTCKRLVQINIRQLN